MRIEGSTLVKIGLCISTACWLGRSVQNWGKQGRDPLKWVFAVVGLASSAILYLCNREKPGPGKPSDPRPRHYSRLLEPQQAFQVAAPVVEPAVVAAPAPVVEPAVVAAPAPVELLEPADDLFLEPFVEQPIAGDLKLRFKWFMTEGIIIPLNQWVIKKKVIKSLSNHPIFNCFFEKSNDETIKILYQFQIFNRARVKSVFLFSAAYGKNMELIQKLIDVTSLPALIWIQEHMTNIYLSHLSGKRRPALEEAVKMGDLICAKIKLLQLARKASIE